MRLQALLTALTCAVAFAPLVVFVLRRRRGPAVYALAALWLVVVGGVYEVGRRYRPDLLELQIRSRRPVESDADGYVSSNACRACHPDQYASWHDSYHRTMTQVVSPESVVDDVEHLTFARGDQPTYELRRHGDTYWVATDDPGVARGPGEGDVVRRPLALVTGSHHEQVFWMLSDEGRRMHLFPYVYRIPEDRWVPFMWVFVAPDTIPQSPDRMWNRSCLRCHTTHPRPRFGTGPIDTKVGEFGIACEACHGPGKEHIEANQNPLRRYALHVDGEDGDATITHPARLSHERAAESCGLCHSVSFAKTSWDAQHWIERGFRFRPGQDLAEHRYLVEYRDPGLDAPNRIRPDDPLYWGNRFWDDGVIRVGGREFSAIRKTRCYLEGELSCTSCHEMHRDPRDPRPAAEWADDMLIAGYEGRVGQDSNVACLQCHESMIGRETEHSHHAAGSEGNSCYNCHMPHQNWGLLKATRNHQVASPDIGPDLAVGRPNACNLCHLDRTLEWTAGYLEAWYGKASPEIPDVEQRRTAASLLYALRGDAGQRALASWAMAWPPAQDVSGTDWMTPVLAWLLEDPYGAVRSLASRSLATLPGTTEVDFFLQQEQGRALRPGVLDAWRRRSPEATESTHPAVLLDSRGQLREDRLRALLSQRDDRPLLLAE